jgi:hypothetical protein
MSAKKTAKKKRTATKKASPATKKKMGKAKTAKKTAKKAAKKTTRTRRALGTAFAAQPRKEDVPGYSTGVRDYARWPDVAIALRVRPFYTGEDSVPFGRLRAHLVPDPTRGNQPANDFYLAGA